MACVLHHSRATGVDRLVMLGIANHDGDGGAWPSIGTLAKYAAASERSVQRAIRRLEELGEIKVYARAGGGMEVRGDRRPNRYDVLLACPPGCQGSRNHRVNEVTRVSPRRVADEVTLEAERGDTGVANEVTTVSPEPSLNHPEPSSTEAEVGRVLDAIRGRLQIAAHWSLKPYITARLEDGWTVEALIDHTCHDTLEGAKSPTAVLVSRIRDAGPPPAPARRRTPPPPWCGECDPQGESDIGARMVSVIDEDGVERWGFCPVCYPPNERRTA